MMYMWGMCLNAVVFTVKLQKAGSPRQSWPITKQNGNNRFQHSFLQPMKCRVQNNEISTCSLAVKSFGCTAWTWLLNFNHTLLMVNFSDFNDLHLIWASNFKEKQFEQFEHSEFEFSDSTSKPCGQSINQVRPEQPKLQSNLFSRRANKLILHCSALDISLAEKNVGIYCFRSALWLVNFVWGSRFL